MYTSSAGGQSRYDWADDEVEVLNEVNRLVKNISAMSSVTVCTVIPRVRKAIHDIKRMTKHYHPVTMSDIMMVSHKNSENYCKLAMIYIVVHF
mgnify:FL=1